MFKLCELFKTLKFGIYLKIEIWNLKFFYQFEAVNLKTILFVC